LAQGAPPAYPFHSICNCQRTNAPQTGPPALKPEEPPRRCPLPSSEPRKLRCPSPNRKRFLGGRRR